MKTNNNRECAFFKDGACSALINTPTCNPTCSFRKSPAECIEGRLRSTERIRSLDSRIQRAIADTYYRGAMPWNKCGTPQ